LEKWKIQIPTDELKNLELVPCETVPHLHGMQDRWTKRQEAIRDIFWKFFQMNHDRMAVVVDKNCINDKAYVGLMNIMKQVACNLNLPVLIGNFKSTIILTKMQLRDKNKIAEAIECLKRSCIGDREIIEVTLGKKEEKKVI